MKSYKEKKIFVEKLLNLMKSQNRPVARTLKEIGIPHTTFNNWKNIHMYTRPEYASMRKIITGLKPSQDFIDSWIDIAAPAQLALFYENPIKKVKKTKKTAVLKINTGETLSTNKLDDFLKQCNQLIEKNKDNAVNIKNTVKYTKRLGIEITFQI